MSASVARCEDGNGVRSSLRLPPKALLIKRGINREDRLDIIDDALSGRGGTGELGGGMDADGTSPDSAFDGDGAVGGRFAGGNGERADR